MPDELRQRDSPAKRAEQIEVGRYLVPKPATGMGLLKYDSETAYASFFGRQMNCRFFNFVRCKKAGHADVY